MIFWKAGERHGLYGVGKIVSDIHQRADGDSVVDVIYEGCLARPILYDDLREHPVLSNMLIMRQQQGTNFRVTPDEWTALQPLLGEIIPPDPDAVDGREAIEPQTPKYKMASSDCSRPIRNWPLRPHLPCSLSPSCYAVGWIHRNGHGCVKPLSAMSLRPVLAPRPWSKKS